MLGVAALASRPWPPFAEGGYVMTGASHPTVTRDARPARILRAAPQVMSLPTESMTVIATTSCRTRTIRISCRGRLGDLMPRETVMPPRSASSVGSIALFGDLFHERFAVP